MLYTILMKYIYPFFLQKSSYGLLNNLPKPEYKFDPFFPHTETSELHKKYHSKELQKNVYSNFVKDFPVLIAWDTDF